MSWYELALLLILFVFVYMYVQAGIFKKRVYRLSKKAGFRFLHLTDIHIGLLHISSNRIKKIVDDTNPDYVLISGDFLDKPRDLGRLVKWLEGLHIKVPVYAVLGNHEHGCFKHHPAFREVFLSTMKKLNIKVLVNETVLLQKKSVKVGVPDRTVALVGMDDWKTGTPVNHKIFDGLREKSSCVLCISHNPDIALNIPENSVDLLITGHFHGGQMWLPFNLEYLLLRKEKVCRMGYIKGFATIRKNRVYISRGLGTVLFPFRFFSIPEVTIFDI